MYLQLTESFLIDYHPNCVNGKNLADMLVHNFMNTFNSGIYKPFPDSMKCLAENKYCVTFPTGKLGVC